MKTTMHILFIGLLLCLSTLTNGQSKQRIIKGAWIYIGSWDSLRHTEDIELVKSWDTSTICVISFEKGAYSVSDESGNYREKGSWTIQRQPDKDVIVVKSYAGQLINFEIVSVTRSKLKLRRLK